MSLKVPAKTQAKKHRLQVLGLTILSLYFNVLFVGVTVLKYLISLLAIAFSLMLKGQHFPSKQYMISDGMPGNSIYDIAQDQNGMMWFMTKAGPAYYNTRTWVVFPDSLNLPNSTNSRIRASGNRIWVAGLNDTAITIQRYHEGDWVKVSTPEVGRDPMGILLFDLIDQGDEYLLLLGFKDALYVYSSQDHSWHLVFLPDGMVLNNIQTIDGRLLVSTTIGLYEYKADELQRVPLPYDALPSPTILSLDQKEDNYYVLGYNWFGEMSEDKVHYIIPDAGLSTSALSAKSSVVVHKGLVLFGAHSPSRLVNRSERSFQDLLIDGNRMNIGSSRIFADKEGTIWVSDMRGLFKFNLLQFENYNRNSGLAADEVTVVLQTADEKMILANTNQLNVLDDGKIINLQPIVRGKENFRILDILEDPNDYRLLIASNDGGLLVYERDQYDQPSKILNSSERITTVERYRDKTYVAGGKGFFQLRGERLVPIAPDLKSIRNLRVLGSRLGLFTTGQGLHLYDGKKFEHFISPVFSLRSVYDGLMYRGEILLATRDGLATLSEGQIVKWKGPNINSPVYALLVDRSLNLWIGADHGVYRYDGKDLELYDTHEGLLGNEVNRNGLIEDSKGQIWIGTEKGVSLFKGRSQMENSINLQVTIESILVNGEPSIFPQKIQRLKYDENNLRIAFQCLSYVDEQQLNFRYRLKSADDEWISLSNEVEAVALTNLEPGAYQFEIQARFAIGDWGPSAFFNFKIDKPFYNEWWFYLVVGLCLMVVARTLFYFRYLLLIRKQHTLKALIAARTQEIRELNNQLEEKVKERTKELQDKNLQLEEYAFINAHHLRAPLAKIMGAIQIVEDSSDQELNKEVLNIMKDSVQELDQVIYSINDILRDD